MTQWGINICLVFEQFMGNGGAFRVLPVKEELGRKDPDDDFKKYVTK